MNTVMNEEVCSTCVKKNVCKFQEEYKLLQRRVVDLNVDKGGVYPFSVKTFCKEWFESKIYRK